MRSPFLARLSALAYSTRIAVEDDLGRRTFAELHARALHARAALCDGAASLEGRRVALLASPGTGWVESFLGILLGGGVALPLSPLYPPSELAWFAADAGADTVILSPEHASRAEELVAGRRVLSTEDLAAAASSGRAPEAGEAIAAIAPSDTALLLYTSGTTGKPKGAMLTHENLAVHASLLHEAWGFSEADTLLHALPLHHLHGLGISLLTSLLAGARTRMLSRFDARRVWDELASRQCTAWMAVPTMYQKLLEVFDAEGDEARARWALGRRRAPAGHERLGGAARHDRRALGGDHGRHPARALRYDGDRRGHEQPARPGGAAARHGRRPLPSVEWRIVDDAGRDTESLPGELLIRGPSVFKGYFGRDEATAAAFSDGWFRTGDIAERTGEGYVRLLGRTLCRYPQERWLQAERPRDRGVPARQPGHRPRSPSWACRTRPGASGWWRWWSPRPGRAADCAAEVIRAWAKERLAPYKVPRDVLTVAALPRNPMGKVVKPRARQGDPRRDDRRGGAVARAGRCHGGQACHASSLSRRRATMPACTPSPSCATAARSMRCSPRSTPTGPT